MMTIATLAKTHVGLLYIIAETMVMRYNAEPHIKYHCQQYHNVGYSVRYVPYSTHVSFTFHISCRPLLVDIVLDERTCMGTEIETT